VIDFLLLIATVCFTVSNLPLVVKMLKREPVFLEYSYGMLQATACFCSFVFFAHSKLYMPAGQYLLSFIVVATALVYRKRYRWINHNDLFASLERSLHEKETPDA
jgi:hypothetical protein